MNNLKYCEDCANVPIAIVYYPEIANTRIVTFWILLFVILGFWKSRDISISKSNFFSYLSKSKFATKYLLGIVCFLSEYVSAVQTFKRANSR